MCIHDQKGHLSQCTSQQTGYQFNSEESEQLYQIVNDYIAQNDEASVDAKLPFEVTLDLRVAHIFRVFALMVKLVIYFGFEKLSAMS